jgi:transcription initiation factor TFIIIB Brf1 subunit/transcription initiation factor TFIIB
MVARNKILVNSKSGTESKTQIRLLKSWQAANSPAKTANLAFRLSLMKKFTSRRSLLKRTIRSSARLAFFTSLAFTGLVSRNTLRL